MNFTAAGCKKSPGGEGTAASGAGPKAYRFAFITNNSADFWNIAEKGVHKAEKDLGIQAVVMRPLKTEVGEQQRFIEDILVQGFDGMAIAPISPDPMTPLRLNSTRSVGVSTITSATSPEKLMSLAPIDSSTRSSLRSG